jgi:hypothetical protein
MKPRVGSASSGRSDPKAGSHDHSPWHVMYRPTEVDTRKAVRFNGAPTCAHCCLRAPALGCDGAGKRELKTKAEPTRGLEEGGRLYQAVSTDVAAMEVHERASVRTR